MLIRRHLTSVSRNFEASSYAKDLAKSYLRKTGNLSLCLNNADVAEQVCKTIKADLLGTDGQALVLESTPGPGILTEALLRHGAHKLRVFEHLENRRQDLMRLKDTYGQRLEIVDKQILDLANGNYKMIEIERNELLRDCFHGLEQPKQHWGDGNDSAKEESSQLGVPYRMIGALSPHICREFLTFLVYSLSQFDSLFLYGPAEFYLFVPVSNYRQMVSRPMLSTLKYYTAFTIHINTLFDYEVIEFDTFDRITIDNRITVPIIPKESFSYTNSNAFKASDCFTLIKIRPKHFVGHCNIEFLYNFVMFVKQSFMKPSNHVVKYYEQHFPGCTMDLINMRVSYFKTFADITAEEMFAIFKLLYNKPQYRTSIFKDIAC